MSRSAQTARAGKAIWVGVIALIILVICYALPLHREAKSPVSSSGSGADTIPPGMVVVSGACPFEGCRLGRWLSRESIPVHGSPGGAVSRDLLPGEAVNAISSEVRAVPRMAVVTRTYQSDEEQGLHVGSHIYVLYPIGEGAVAVWAKGRVIRGSLDLAFRFENSAVSPPLQWEWWVQIRLGDGAVGWLRNPQGRLEGMDKHS